MTSSPTVTIATPSRLSITLLDLNGELGRVDGSIGLALRNPGFIIRARRSDTLRISAAEDEVAENFRSRIEDVIARFRERFGIGALEIKLERTIPDHSGLGSGTQLAMAVGRAANDLYAQGLDCAAIAGIVGRGGTSGAGVIAFRAGGFIVEGGHRFGSAGAKNTFAPSSASAGLPPAPLIFHRPLPRNWSILIAVPRGRRIHSDEERDLFRRLCPLPRSEVEKLAHLTLLKIIPAIVEEDLEAFGAGIEAVQQLGFKRHEIAMQTDFVRATIDHMRRAGLAGVGMSSWGPALFGFGSRAKVEQALATTQDFMRAGEGGTAFIAEADDQGAIVHMHTLAE